MSEESKAKLIAFLEPEKLIRGGGGDAYRRIKRIEQDDYGTFVVYEPVKGHYNLGGNVNKTEDGFRRTLLASFYEWARAWLPDELVLKARRGARY